MADRRGHTGGLNMYSYVGADPINGVDPTGTSRIDYYRMGRHPEEGSARSGGQFERSFFAGQLLATGYYQYSSNPSAPASGLTGSAGTALDRMVFSCTTCGPGYYDENESIVVTAADWGWRMVESGWADFSTWFTTPRAHDISGTSYCWKACGPGLDPVQVYSPAEQLGTAAAVGTTFGTALAAPGVPGLLANSRTFGVQSTRFGHPAFGAARRGNWNTGYLRAGWGRGLGSANFRVGAGNPKIDLFSVPIPKGGF